MNFDELDRRLRVFETAHDMNIVECCTTGTLEIPRRPGRHRYESMSE